MKEQYLWNREGEPDPEVAELENLLEPFRYQPKPQISSAIAERKQVRRHSHFTWWVGIAAAAVLASIAVGVWRVIPKGTEDSTWKLSAGGATPHAVRTGQTIDTGESGAQLESEFVGQVSVGPGSRLQILPAAREVQRLALEHGTIHAFIWAPPRGFVVDTPSATTIDLGCEYTLHVAPNGTGSLNVEMGWVAFQWGNLESFIPAGASCRTRPGRGPGTPYFSGAPAEFTSALGHFDESGDSKTLQVVLAAARPHDALTLWHLLSRTHGVQRAEVFARFSQLVKPQPTITKERILRGDPAALDAAWNALGLGNTEWWREWKRRW